MNLATMLAMMEACGPGRPGEHCHYPAKQAPTMEMPRSNGEPAVEKEQSSCQTNTGLQIVPKEKWPAHIQALKLPPAWKDVRVSMDPDADLLAIGKDAKGRDQYVYSERFQATKAAEKFERIAQLEQQIGTIDKQLSAARNSSNEWESEHADCALLIRKMGIRPGSNEDTSAKVKAYGATTLEGRHVVTDGNSVRLQFVGKKGVSIDLEVTDPVLRKMLVERKAAAGDSGKLFKVSDGSLLDFMHSKIDHGRFKTKDFRTLLGTTMAKKMVASMEMPADKKSYVKAVKDIATKVSKVLGNTPTVALQSYIAPQVFAEWRARHAA